MSMVYELGQRLEKEKVFYNLKELYWLRNCNETFHFIQNPHKVITFHLFYGFIFLYRNLPFQTLNALPILLSFTFHEYKNYKTLHFQCWVGCWVDHSPAIVRFTVKLWNYRARKQADDPLMWWLYTLSGHCTGLNFVTRLSNFAR